MEGEENEIVLAVDTDVSDDDNNSDSDDEDQQESYLTSVRYHSKCSKTELKRLLKSIDPEDQKVLNKIVSNILSCDDDEAFYYLLIKGHKLGASDEKGVTIYHRAYYQNSLSILSLLFRWRFDDESDHFDHVDGNGLSYLHIASFVGSEKSVNDYLKSNNNINAHYQCNFDNCEYVIEISRGGFTPLHFAVINYKAEKVMRLLLDNGADVSAVDLLNRTPLHIACCSYESPEYIDIAYVTYSSIDAMEILVEYKSDVNARDNDGNTPLLSIFPDDFGVFETTRGIGFIESIPVLEIKKKLKFLLQQEVDVNARNKNGDNILHLIVRNLEHWRCSATYSELSFDFDVDHLEMIKQIFEVNPEVNVNSRNNKGESPLQLAVSFISSSIVKILLEHGADLSGIGFDYQDLDCFVYPKILPDLDAVRNLIVIVDMLVNNDWELTLEGNLAILKFLVHDVNDCQCRSLLDVLHLGSFKHIEHILKKKIDALSDNSGTDKNQIIIDTKQYFLTRLIIGATKDIEVLHKILIVFNKLSVEVTVEEESLIEMIIEKVRMQCIKVRSNFTLHDVLAKHPNDIYFLDRNDDFHSILKNFPVYEHVVKGHIAKAFIRRYLENSAYAYLKKLSFVYLPYTCCKRILHYSSNEDILNLCLAAILDNF